MVQKPFDFQEYKDRVLAKLGASKQEVINALKAPLKIVVAESVDFVAESCLASPNNIVKGLSGLAAAVKQPLLDGIDKI